MNWEHCIFIFKTRTSTSYNVRRLLHHPPTQQSTQRPSIFWWLRIDYPCIESLFVGSEAASILNEGMNQSYASLKRMAESCRDWSEESSRIWSEGITVKSKIFYNYNQIYLYIFFTRTYTPFSFSHILIRGEECYSSFASNLLLLDYYAPNIMSLSWWSRKVVL